MHASGRTRAARSICTHRRGPRAPAPASAPLGTGERAPASMTKSSPKYRRTPHKPWRTRQTLCSLSPTPCTVVICGTPIRSVGVPALRRHRQLTRQTVAVPAVSASTAIPADSGTTDCWHIRKLQSANQAVSQRLPTVTARAKPHRRESPARTRKRTASCNCMAEHPRRAQHPVARKPAGASSNTRARMHSLEQRHARVFSQPLTASILR